MQVDATEETATAIQVEAAAATIQVEAAEEATKETTAAI